MRLRWVLASSACMVLGVATVRPLAQHVAVFRVLEGHESVHIVVHALLYGTLVLLALGAGLTASRAALLALGVGVLQESAQLLGAGRGPGWPELFDLCVDAVAIGCALVAAHRFRSVRGVRERSACRRRASDELLDDRALLVGIVQER